jgi:adenylate cyclase
MAFGLPTFPGVNLNKRADGENPGPRRSIVMRGRRVAACLHADISGYSQLIAHDVQATIRALKIYRAMLGRITVAHGGRVIDDSGDSVLAEFPEVTGAVRAAIEIQRQLTARNAALPAHRRLAFRVGIELGDVLADGHRIYGDCINVAARVQELAAPGGICLAGSAFDQIDGSLPQRFDYLGERTVKNIERPLRVYRFSGE